MLSTFLEANGNGVAVFSILGKSPLFFGAKTAVALVQSTEESISCFKIEDRCGVRSQEGGPPVHAHGGRSSGRALDTNTVGLDEES